MPVVELSLMDLEKLLGKKLPEEEDQLNEILQYAKCEVERLEGDELAVSVEDGNRPDLWCPEGIARELSGSLGKETGLVRYKPIKSHYTVKVAGEIGKIRPFIACAVVRGCVLNDQIIKQLMQQQDKIDRSYGRNRIKSSIGLYDVDKIEWPIKYTAGEPESFKFVPLGMEEEMNLQEILEKHPKGEEYGHILSEHSFYPVFLDYGNRVLSFPPITNSNDIGRITSDTRNVLIEVTGTDWETVTNVLNIMAATLADRSGKIFNVSIEYPYKIPTGHKKITTPLVRNQRMKIGIEYVNNVLGTNLKQTEILKILGKGRYGASMSGKNISVQIPFYRTDIMHPVDVVEDIAIHYGYDKFDPELKELPTSGGISKEETVSDKIRELCVGLGCQEIMSFTLTNKDSLFYKMGVEEQPIIELENPISSEFSCLRNWMLPSLMQVFSSNKHNEFPQMIFEVGDCVVPDEVEATGARTVRKACIAICQDKVNLTQAKSMVEGIMKNIGIDYRIEQTMHPSFIEDRVGEITSGGNSVGFFGEVHPQVLLNWGLEIPVIVIEFEI